MENDSQELIKDMIEEQDFPFAREMQSFNPEEKNIGLKNIQKIHGQESTLIDKDEKAEPKKEGNKQEIVFTSLINFESNFGAAVQKRIPLIAEEFFEEKIKKTEIHNTFLGKKITKNEFESQKKSNFKEYNVNKNIKKNNCFVNDEGFDYDYEDNSDKDSIYNNFYGIEEDENDDDNKNNNIEETIAFWDDKDFHSEKDNITLGRASWRCGAWMARPSSRRRRWRPT